MDSAETLKASQQVLERMRAVQADVLAKREQAKSSRDAVKLNCVAEKLEQVTSLLRVCERSVGYLRDALSASDWPTAEHEYTKVTVAGQKVDVFRAEAEDCVGQLALQTDESTVVEVEPPEELVEDPTNPTPPPELVTPPALVEAERLVEDPTSPDLPPRPPPASPTL